MNKAFFSPLILVALLAVCAPSVAHAAIGKAPNNLGLVGYWSFDDCRKDKATDSSGYGNTGTLTNFALSGATSNWVTGAQAKRGCALNFDGTDDYVALSTQPPRITSDWSASAWIYSDSFKATGGYAISTTAGGADGDWYLGAYNGALAFYGWLDGGAGDVGKLGPTMSTGRWYHVVWTWRRSGSVVNLYVDGVARSLVDTSNSGAGVTQNDIGRVYTSSAYYFRGSLDDVRIYNRALSANEVTALYNTGAAKVKASSNNGLVGYWSFDDCRKDKASDSSGSGNTGTLTNFALTGAASNWTTGTQAKRGCALNFDGSNDYVDIGDKTPLKITGAFTTSAWFRLNTISNEQYFYAKSPVGGASGVFFGMYQSKVVAGANSSYTSSAVIPDTNWHHAVGTYDGTNVRVYVDGVLSGGPTAISVPTDNTSSALLGKAGFGFPLNGSLDEVRIYNRALSANEVTALYNTGAAKVKASNNNGLVGYWSFDDCRKDKASDSSGYGNTGTLTNFALSGATSNWTTAGKRGCALKFDGSNDYITVPDTSAQQVTRATFSAWIKTTSPSITQAIVNKCNSGTGGNYYGPETAIVASKLYFEWQKQNIGNLFSFAGSRTLTANTWYFATFTYDGTTAKIYLNGVLDGSAVASNDPPTWANSKPTIIGGGLECVNGVPGALFSGSIDDVRIYNRALSANEVQSLYNAY